MAIRERELYLFPKLKRVLNSLYIPGASQKQREVFLSHFNPNMTPLAMKVMLNEVQRTIARKRLSYRARQTKVALALERKD